MTQQKVVENVKLQACALSEQFSSAAGANFDQHNAAVTIQTAYRGHHTRLNKTNLGFDDDSEHEDCGATEMDPLQELDLARERVALLQRLMQQQKML